MEFLSEYRDPELAARHLEEIKKAITKPWTIMEVCGVQTHSLVKNGILNILPKEINMVHGPGCPVCVTPLNLIDKAVYLAEAKANGADIRILYSPLEAVKIAQQHPEKEIVFFAVGFETTAPANALSVVHAHRLRLSNYSILASHVLVPTAIDAVMADENTQIQAFLAAGYVCTIMGTREHGPLVDKYQVPTNSGHWF